MQLSQAKNSFVARIFDSAVCSSAYYTGLFIFCIHLDGRVVQSRKVTRTTKMLNTSLQSDRKLATGHCRSGDSATLVDLARTKR